MNKKNKSFITSGFTLIELIVVIAIIGILSAVTLFGVKQYINRGKDSNIMANLAILVPAGEVFYNANYGNGYEGFCASSVIENAKAEIPIKENEFCGNDAGFCCGVDIDNNQTWASCVQLFTDTSKAFCVDSRGIKKVISNENCVVGISLCQ